MNTTALAQSGVLTLVGMTVIFLFMGLLIVIVHFFVAIATRFFPDREDAADVSSGTGGSPDEETAAAIATAALTHAIPLHGKVFGRRTFASATAAAANANSAACGVYRP